MAHRTFWSRIHRQAYWRESDQLDNHDRFVHTRKNQFALWSAAFGWQQRIIAQDRRNAAAAERRHRAQVEKLNEDQFLWAQGMAALAMKHIQDLIKAKAFNAHATVLLFKYATDLQRLSLGADMVQVCIEEESGDVEVSTPGIVPGSGNIMICACCSAT